jgi:glycosyltransferase involved in cell wall biosynthesis
VWDAVSALRVDKFIANSSIVSRRIRKFYRADSEVIFPPVATSRFCISEEVGDYYVIVARAAPYRRLDIAVDAFTKLKIPLKLAGDGRQMQSLRARAGANVEFLGRVSDKELPDLLSRSRGYVMPGEEDFGIAPIEANASGRPVIAFAAGGALDSQIDGETAILFAEQTVESLCEAVIRAESTRFDPHQIRLHAQKFDTGVFRAKMHTAVVAAVKQNGHETFSCS